LQQGFLSDTELYYSPKIISTNRVIIEGDELHHLKVVMRHNEGDEIFITDGIGNLYKTELMSISKSGAECSIIEKKYIDNNFENIVFCIPRLKNNDRFEFALEKSVELGITNFIVFESERTVAKGDKTEKWQRFLISAMKQSLHTWIPKIEYRNSIKFLLDINDSKIVLDQKAKTKLSEYLTMNKNKKEYFIFGPEGGFADTEIERIKPNFELRLTDNRLRSETAIVSTASLISIYR